MRITLYILILILVTGVMPFVRAAAPTPASNNIVIDPSGIIYRTQAGDTLISIAQRLTTKSGNWLILGKINHISKDSSIPIGTPITIPADLLADEASEATVIARSGTITATYADGKTTTIDVGSKIAEGIKINTGTNSFLTISLSDASRISLPSNSCVLLAKLRKTLYTGSPRTEIKLLHGRVVSRVSPLNVNKGRFEVRTTSSVAGVRGTYFRIDREGDNVLTEVLDGHVAVSAPPAPEIRMLDAAKGNVIVRNVVGPAIDLLPAPTLANAPYKQESATQFTLTPIASAHAYRVQLAQDAEVLNLLAEASSNSTTVTIGNVPEGDYFVRLSAVDQYGLEGIPRTLAVTLKNRSGSANVPQGQGAPSIASSDQKALILRWPGPSDQKYNIQIARNAGFSWLLFSASITGNEVKLARPPFGTYYARVQSVNADGSTNPFSQVQALVVTDQWIINDGYPRPQEAYGNANQ